jgi:hypothetical protein
MFDRDCEADEYEYGADKVIRGPYLGNEATQSEHWYYAAAVVVSLGKG